MSVYVDPLMECATSSKWRWTKACHLYADTPEELHDFAAKIGMRRQWCSDVVQPNSKLLHYDLNESRRNKAVKAGAVETTHRHLALIMTSKLPEGHPRRKFVEEFWGEE